MAELFRISGILLFLTIMCVRYLELESLLNKIQMIQS